MNKIKVLHILWSGGIGGLEEYISCLANYFDQSKYEIYLCFLNKKGSIYEEAVKKYGQRVTFIGVKNTFDVLGILLFAKYLYRERFDILHSHVRIGNLFALLFYFYKAPVLITHHLGTGPKELNKKARLFYKFYSYSFRRIIAISHDVKRNLIERMKIKPDKIDVLCNGVDTNKYSKSLPLPDDLQSISDSDKVILGFVGRMHYFKRPGLFIDVAAEIVKRRNDFIFIMAGDGPELARCQKIINNYKIDKYFKLLGFRRDIPSIINLFDAMLFTSKGEGFGLVIIEAMAMGVPVFAINDGAVSEIIRHNENGILLDTTDPEVVARKIIDTCEDEKLVRKIKKQSIEDVKSRFSLEVSARRTEEIYEEVLRENSINTCDRKCMI